MFQNRFLQWQQLSTTPLISFQIQLFKFKWNYSSEYKSNFKIESLSEITLSSVCLPFWVSCTFSFPLHTLTPIPAGVSGKFAELYPNSKLSWFGMMSSPRLALSHHVLTSHACAEWSRRGLTKSFRVTFNGIWLFEQISVLIVPIPQVWVQHCGKCSEHTILSVLLGLQPEVMKPVCSFLREIFALWN